MAETNSGSLFGSEFKALIHALLDDAAANSAGLNSESPQLVRRNFVRSLFAAIEGMTYVMKQICLNAEGQKPGTYTPAEVAMLQDVNFTVSEKGQAESQIKYLATDVNLRFALNMVLRRLNESFRLDVSGRGWQDFQKSLRVRHRLTHPKRQAGLEISDAELECCKRAFSWIVSVIIDQALHAFSELKTGQERILQIVHEKCIETGFYQTVIESLSNKTNTGTSKDACSTKTPPAAS